VEYIHGHSLKTNSDKCLCTTDDVLNEILSKEIRVASDYREYYVDHPRS